MNKIKILPDNIINQIAAGEVVENPSSVVKELIENSIDSKASNIKIIIKNGGHDLIEVIDDGLGMSRDDLLLAFSRHATSKIKNKDDLKNISSLGFRGEALPSIASVSRVNVLASDGNEGHEISIDKGEVVKREKSAITKGTDIKIKNLFYNTPARKKFLKSPSQELRNITKIVKRFILSYPEISFMYQSDDKIIYKFNSTSLDKRIIQLFGDSYAKNIISIDSQDGNSKISGYVGSLNLLQKRRGNQYIFLNGRFIVNESISNSIRNCYDSIIQRGEFPFFVLFLELTPSAFDINVHPTKIEARFSEKWNIINFITSNIKKELKKILKVLPDINFTSKIDSIDNDLRLDLELNSNLDLKAEDGISSKINELNNEIDSDIKIEKAINRLNEYKNETEALIA